MKLFMETYSRHAAMILRFLNKTGIHQMLSVSRLAALTQIANMLSLTTTQAALRTLGAHNHVQLLAKAPLGERKGHQTRSDIKFSMKNNLGRVRLNIKCGTHMMMLQMRLVRWLAMDAQIAHMFSLTTIQAAFFTLMPWRSTCDYS